MTQGGIHVYLKIWQNRYIQEVKTHDHKTCPRWGIQVRMHESSKLGYTSTFNTHK